MDKPTEFMFGLASGDILVVTCAWVIEDFVQTFSTTITERETVGRVHIQYRGHLRVDEILKDLANFQIVVTKGEALALSEKIRSLMRSSFKVVPPLAQKPTDSS